MTAAVQTIKHRLSEDDGKIKIVKSSHNGPLPHAYKMELGVTGECNAKQVYWFQQLNGIL